MELKTSKALGIAGKPGRKPRVALPRFFGSLSFKLVLLVAIFVLLPFVLYGHLERADRQTRSLLTDSLQNRSWLIAQAITPLLAGEGGGPGVNLNETLAKFTQPDTVLKLAFRPGGNLPDRQFFLVATAPTIPAHQVNPELDALAGQGVLTALADSCDWDTPIDFRYTNARGTEELLTSVISIKQAAGCWVLISTHNSTALLSTAIGRPYWQTEDIRLAAVVYFAFALLALLIALSVRRSLRHFQDVAQEIRRGGGDRATFASRNIVPELASVARHFDHLVHDLHRVAGDIRRNGEENAHAIKTPLAIIRSALEPIKRCMTALDQRSQRSVQIIENSLERLNALVSAAQRVGDDTADIIEAPRVRVSLTAVTLEVVQGSRSIAAEHGVTIVHHLEDDVYFFAPEGVLDLVLENILDNALSFSPPNGRIIVTLTKTRQAIGLFVEDEGPGITPDQIDYIFERSFSRRPLPPAGENGADQTPAHAGLGLWIVHRHTDALGGRVAAANRPGGGLCIHLSLPCNEY